MSVPKEKSVNADIGAGDAEGMFQSPSSCIQRSKLLPPQNIIPIVHQSERGKFLAGHNNKENTSQSEVQSNIHAKLKRKLDSGGTSSSSTQPSSKPFKKRSFFPNISSVSSSLLQQFEDTVEPGLFIFKFVMKKLFLIDCIFIYYKVQGMLKSLCIW